MPRAATTVGRAHYRAIVTQAESTLAAALGSALLDSLGLCRGCSAAAFRLEPYARSVMSLPQGPHRGGATEQRPRPLSSQAATRLVVGQKVTRPAVAQRDAGGVGESPRI
jgi:hypothetical protein